MNVLIVEDEIVAASRLKKLVKACSPEIEVIEVLNTILDTSNYLLKNNPDLIFLDIQLSDGICFELFEKQEIDIPIIFTTAYDHYMQQAFKVNSVDYLLKPVRPEELKNSIEKFKKYKQPQTDTKLLNDLFAQFVKEKNAYKCRFMVRSGRGFISVDVRDIAYIIAQNKLNYIITKMGKRYVIDYTLDQLQRLLDPKEFLKINRNYIISNSSIVKIEPYFNNRMLVEVDPPANEDVLVSRNYLKNFKAWMDR
ncbi:LytTR family DNA-binding domain-containing protein [Fulvivirgaceae bacterium BMA10]|uniref:LytTR family DNA-binding domain-containing protein n=1 Tax=Splendidivirga corallicola TaxID=3051826 RepID=A0ABT8KSG3_9BACT|nr:LytTR family DNA-binding domain-containing protein [Fulvivirgaceae bacterium BMA10]